MGDNIHVMIVF